MSEARSEGAHSTSTSASSPTASGSTGNADTDDIFVRHRLEKMDTLAGLAVKYNVTVSDIKRANGFQSDTAMFGKDTLLIPTKPLPIGPEYAAWAGIIVAHYGKMPSRGLRNSSAAALNELRGYYSTSQSISGTPYGSDDEFGEAFGKRHTPHGEVELMSRQQSSQGAPHYIEDRLRRRRNLEDDDCEFEELPRGFIGNGGGRGDAQLAGPSFLRPSLFRSSTDRRERSELMGTGLHELKEWHRKSLRWKDMLLTKLKKVASQPALATRGTSSTMAQAAEAAIASARPVAPAGSNIAQQLQAAAYSIANQRQKDCPKAD